MSPVTVLINPTSRKKTKKITIFEPEALDVLENNFNYLDYINDVIALKDGVYQGCFKDLENIFLEKLFHECDALPKRKLDYNTYIFLNQLEQKYYYDINVLQQEFDKCLNQGDEINHLNKRITQSMKQVAQKYLQSIEIVNRFNIETPKRLEEITLSMRNKQKEQLEQLKEDFAKGLIDWKDMPIETIMWCNETKERKMIYYKIRSLPNTPENHKMYTINQLLEINKEFIVKKEGKTKK